ncbi:hypothetical protein ACFFJY_14590 [Fictibacillus aquaticus]|uniref:Uncharacterized protein n=1 Tax=Fictibacillus aquaticus TaxID=2021314 RepID=A0A235FDP7_9BACL|nr:hypothetical protein [Fictibacillus aquaticus]OYD59441.1 hypothetical protein CGZ90_06010 [Fictibacillus aquaticus]
MVFKMEPSKEKMVYISNAISSTILIMLSGGDILVIFYKLLKFIFIVFFIIVYLNGVHYLTTLFDLQYTMFEFVLIIAAVIFAFITSEMLFKEKAQF